MGAMGPMGGGYMDLNAAIMSSFADVDAREAVNQAAAVASAAENDEEKENNDDDEDVEMSDENKENGTGGGEVPKLSSIFAPPTHLTYRGGGGFQGARTVAKDSKRWLLVNLQRDSEFSSHVLNRDVWRDELVENLIREGFIFWQTMDSTDEGKTYSQRYRVYAFPHIAIIDPRTGRSLWSKEGWTQEKPFDAEAFAEMAMDFCSKHSFDKGPVAPSQPPAKKPGAKTPSTRDFMTEEEQLQAAMAASLEAGTDAKCDNDDDEDEYVMDDDDDEVEYLGTEDEMRDEASKQKSQPEPRPEPEPEPEPKKPPSFIEALLSIEVGEEPSDGGRIQLRMPDAKRMVRKFSSSDTVRTIYAFVAHSSEEAKGGKPFSLMSGFPPKDLEGSIDSTIGDCGLAGQAITVRWKD
eukprot:CAMPEP_0116559596 /NCGR_PEP_ID=MMETSP0397-20121206/10487_1 /TAXON_ID=216820 /ORGANISM="Cyclophora tenuis, Strain ECT3854" /LENGTH=406 /DNA_ID=CAMNT_0004085389 /DNA_START=1 /DNA_END=1221 /DNA_ORIENTATION=-